MIIITKTNYFHSPENVDENVGWIGL